MNKNEKVVLLILGCLQFTHILDFMIMMPLGNYLMPHFNINAQAFTTLVAAYTLSAGFSGFLAAFFVDGYDRKKILLVGYIGFLAGTIGCGLAPTYEGLIAARIVAGLFGGLIGAQVLSIVSDYFTYERRGAAMGAVMSAFAIASTFGVPFALYLANLFSWHAPFLFVGILGILLIPMIIRYIPSMSDHLQHYDEDARKTDKLMQVLKSPIQRSALLFSGLIMMGHFLIVPFINPYLEFNNGYTKAQTPMVYLAGGIASFFASNILGKISDTYGKLRVFLICTCLSLFLVFILTNLPPIPFSWVLALFAIWFTLATGRGVTAQAMISNVVPAASRGSFMSFNSSVQQLGTSAASLLAGWVVIRNADGKILHYAWLGYISIFILVLCILLASVIFKNLPPKRT
jgi:MFS transporter, DHA1 family, inner membrane transport protein